MLLLRWDPVSDWWEIGILSHVISAERSLIRADPCLYLNSRSLFQSRPAYEWNLAEYLVEPVFGVPSAEARSECGIEILLNLE